MTLGETSPARNNQYGTRKREERWDRKSKTPPEYGAKGNGGNRENGPNPATAPQRYSCCDFDQANSEEGEEERNGGGQAVLLKRPFAICREPEESGNAASGAQTVQGHEAWDAKADAIYPQQDSSNSE